MLFADRAAATLRPTQIQALIKYDLFSEEDAIALCIALTPPERVKLGGEVEDMAPDNLLDKVFHSNLKQFTYQPGFANADIEQSWLRRATSSNIAMLKLECPDLQFTFQLATMPDAPEFQFVGKTSLPKILVLQLLGWSGADRG